MTSSNRKWRRTSYTREDGFKGFLGDDWTLFDDFGEPIARIKVWLTPDGQHWWDWSVWINDKGVREVKFGAEATGGQARKKVETMIPPGTFDREAQGRLEYMSRHAHRLRHIQRLV